MGSINPCYITDKTGSQVIIRTATEDDALDVLSLIQSILNERRYSVSEPHELDFNEQQDRDWLEKHVNAPNDIAIVAERKSKIIGLVNCESGSRNRIGHRAVLSLCVHQDHRRIGIASALMKSIVEWAIAHDVIEKLSLAVLGDNQRAIELYEKFGFQVEGRRKREVKFGPDDYVDDLLMYLFVNSPT